ncbi:hypothetical protein F5Y16DRAFT_212735 [Xylariaceae sp. FL0255]|nr:hypothetical protein F5Y16DRAFT_212735 [Xylariaceae sp. FL0255]
MAHDGFLIPTWYVNPQPGVIYGNIASLIWGVALGCAFFAAVKAAKQSWHSHQHGRLYNMYIIIVWVEWVASLSPSSFGFSCGSVSHLVIVWIAQTQCLLQILANRMSILFHKKSRPRQTKTALFIVIALINVFVAAIWLPALLQVKPVFNQLNQIWVRVSMGVLTVADAALNIALMKLVWRYIKEARLKQLKETFWVNCACAGLSVSLDISWLGSVSLPTLPVAY